LSSFANTTPCVAVAALAGALVFPMSESFADSPSVDAEAATSLAEPTLPDEHCLTETLCRIKNKVRWRTPAWTPERCKTIARGVLDSAKRNKVPPALLLAVMMNESDMDENAFRLTLKDGQVYAKDSGLMGIRCVVDKQGRCNNGYVRGLAWKSVMDPLTNIELGARELARWRDGGGITKVTMRVRNADGQIETKEKSVPCQHKTHAYWAHYNHGPRYIDHGNPRHYPHRIAVLYHALAQALDVDAPELRSNRITIHDPGKRPRTADRPVEPRYRKLCEQIREAGSACPRVAELVN
jgi:hypothetical protein